MHRTFYLVDRFGTLGRYLSVFGEKEYLQMTKSLPDFQKDNPILGTGTFRKGRVRSSFNGRSVRLFDCNGSTYEVFTDMSARLQ